MNINDLTIGEAKQIASMFGAGNTDPHPGIFAHCLGKYCIVRSSQSGVHAGVLHAATHSGDGLCTVNLGNARRLWKWKTNGGVSLSAVATSGIVASESKIEPAIDMHTICGVCEIIPCSNTAKESIHGK